MPIEISELKTRSVHEVLRINFITEVTLADVEQYQQRTPDGRYDGWGSLVVGNVTSVSSEVKKKLSSRKRARTGTPVAIVLSSPLMRMAASLTMRVLGTTGSEYFKSEAEGLSWLDERLTELKKRR